MGNSRVIYKKPSSSTLTQITTPNLRTDYSIFLPLEIIHKENSISLQKLKQASIITDFSELCSQQRVAKLQELSSPILELSIKNQRLVDTIKLTPSGWEGSKRQSKDGLILFGSKFKDSEGAVVVDYKLKLTNPSYSDKNRGPHFMIFFDLDLSKFFIRDLMVGLGTFIRIKDQVVLEDDFLLSFGETFVLVNVIPKSHDDCYPKLRLKVIGGNNFSEIFYFRAKEFYLSSIVIGRNKKCQVCVEDSTISKQHASIFFSINKKWVIIDGTATRNSLNGSWLFASKDLELETDTEIKACESILKVLKIL
jgi:hypothetical protein